MRHVVQDADAAEGRWQEWGRGGQPVTWPLAPRAPHDRAAHELSEIDVARISRTLRRRPFHRLAFALLGLSRPAPRRRR